MLKYLLDPVTAMHVAHYTRLQYALSWSTYGGLTTSHACGPDYAICVDWVCHDSELPFVIHVFDDAVSLYYAPAADELHLTEDLANTWSNSIMHGMHPCYLDDPSHIPSRYNYVYMPSDPIHVLGTQSRSPS